MILNHIDYPSNTVPLKVAQLFTAQLFHDRKQRFTRLSAPASERQNLGEPIDYLRPIVADADTVSSRNLKRDFGLALMGRHTYRVMED
jgi:isocitrate lyase